MTVLTVRELSPADAAALRNLRLRCIRAEPYSFSVSLEEELGLTQAQRHSLLSRFSNSRYGFLWGAFSEDELVGMIGLDTLPGQICQHRGLVTGLCVDPDWQRQGIGWQLIRHLSEQALKQPGMQALVLDVSEYSQSAIRLYLRAGFTVTGRDLKALAYGDVMFDMLRMQRAVAPPAQG